MVPAFEMAQERTLQNSALSKALLAAFDEWELADTAWFSRKVFDCFDQIRKKLRPTKSKIFSKHSIDAGRTMCVRAFAFDAATSSKLRQNKDGTQSCVVLPKLRRCGHYTVLPLKCSMY